MDSIASNLLTTKPTTDPTDCKFKTGDFVEFKYLQYRVIYEVIGFLSSGPHFYYELGGRDLLELDKNEHLEKPNENGLIFPDECGFFYWSPECELFDREAILANKELFLKIEQIRKTLKIQKHPKQTKIIL